MAHLTPQPQPALSHQGALVMWSHLLSEMTRLREMTGLDHFQALLLSALLCRNVTSGLRGGGGTEEHCSLPRKPVSVYEVARYLNVSYETARRNLRQLEASGHCTRFGDGLLVSGRLVMSDRSELGRRQAWLNADRLCAELARIGVTVENFVTVIFTMAQVVLGGLAARKVLAREDVYLAAVCGLGAAILPALLKALRVSDHATKAKAAAAEYTALRDRFERAASIDVARPFGEFSGVAQPLFDRMDKARREHDPPPEPIFWLARLKVKLGHMNHDHRSSGRRQLG